MTADEVAWSSWWRAHGERELRCILMTAWDPIGVGEEPLAWDEYDDYAAGVARRLRSHADDDEAARSVADYLDHVERDLMGLSARSGAASNAQLAETLVAWHEWSFTRAGRPPTEWIDE